MFTAVSVLEYNGNYVGYRFVDLSTYWYTDIDIETFNSCQVNGLLTMGDKQFVMRSDIQLSVLSLLEYKNGLYTEDEVQAKINGLLLRRTVDDVLYYCVSRIDLISAKRLTELANRIRFDDDLLTQYNVIGSSEPVQRYHNGDIVLRLRVNRRGYDYDEFNECFSDNLARDLRRKYRKGITEVIGNYDSGKVTVILGVA